MENGSLLIQKLTGSWPVYPGHPLVVATAIMEVFPDFDSARAPGLHGWSAALTDSRIPGASDHVGAAVTVLEIGAKGGSSDEMVQYASEYWENGRAGGHVKNVEAGREQAQLIQQHFADLCSRWFNAAKHT
jgi:hypothetical protein